MNTVHIIDVDEQLHMKNRKEERKNDKAIACDVGLVGWLIGKMKRTREKKSKLRWSSMC